LIAANLANSLVSRFGSIMGRSSKNQSQVHIKRSDSRILQATSPHNAINKKTTKAPQ